MEKQYVCIDLKSFYASVECIERGLDPMTTNLVVADVSRTEKTICLAVTPSLKAHGISGRARLFEVIQQLKVVNAKRQLLAPGHKLTGSSWNDVELKQNPSLAVDYIAAPPQMAHYMDVSTNIYQVYLKYIAPEDIHVYSIDEVFIDLTSYLKPSGLTARQFTSMMIADVLKTTGITAAAGIGTNLYLAKIAMDIEAKHAEPDENGVRIAELDEMTYKQKLWSHRPLTDFWRVGHGYAKKLEENGLYTMGDIARCSLGKDGAYYNEDLLFKLFGVNAELLIDHAWGREPTTIADIKNYKPKTNSISSGQVLSCDYSYEAGKLIVREMADLLALDLVDKGLVTDSITLHIGYNNAINEKPAHGTTTMTVTTSSAKTIVEYTEKLYERIMLPNTSIRRINLTFNNVVDEMYKQYDLFTDPAELERENKMQKAMLDIKKKFGKNAILKGMNLEEGATTMERNRQIGGHKSGE